MTRIPIRLDDESLTALQTLARQECRDVRQQAAWIIERELKRRGLLQANPAPLAILPVEDPKPEQGGIDVTR